MTIGNNDPGIQIGLRPALHHIAEPLALPFVGHGAAGPGWAEILSHRGPVHIRVDQLVRAVTVAEPDALSGVFDESSWTDWLVRGTSEPSRIDAARCALTEIAVAARVAALPRPVPTDLVGAPSIVLRIGFEWLDDLMSEQINGLDELNRSQTKLASYLGISIPALTVQPVDLPFGVFGIGVGNIVFPLHGLPGSYARTSGFAGIATGIREDIRSLPEVLVDDGVLQDMLNHVAVEVPGTVRHVRSIIKRGRMLDGLRGLLAEGVPLSSLDVILDRLLEADLTGVPDAELVGFLRLGLGRQIAGAVADGARVIPAFVLDSQVRVEDAATAIRSVVDGSGGGKVLVARPGIAAEVRAAIRTEFPGLQVLGSDEIPLTCTIEPLAVISALD